MFDVIAFYLAVALLAFTCIKNKAVSVDVTIQLRLCLKNIVIVSFAALIFYQGGLLSLDFWLT